jgi:hypothetical protein
VWPLAAFGAIGKLRLHLRPSTLPFHHVMCLRRWYMRGCHEPAAYAKPALSIALVQMRVQCCQRSIIHSGAWNSTRLRILDNFPAAEAVRSSTRRSSQSHIVPPRPHPLIGGMFQCSIFYGPVFRIRHRANRKVCARNHHWPHRRMQSELLC